jgi:signal transduction histidine kinase
LHINAILGLQRYNEKASHQQSRHIALKKTFSPTLRFQITLGVALPILLGFGGLLLLQYFREQTLIQQEMKSRAINVANTIIRTLQHAMEIHDRQMLDVILENTTTRSDVVGVKFIDKNYVIQSDNVRSELGQTLDPQMSGCKECHQTPGVAPSNVAIELTPNGLLRVATPIHNEAKCQSCHDPADPHIGVLLIDISQTEPLRNAQRNVIQNSLLSLMVTFLISLLVYGIIDRLITRRIKSFQAPLDTYAHGDLSVRLPVSRRGDELDGLAENFNRMANDVQLHIENSKKQGELLQQTIIAERERIARELHDSLPQLLAYLNTKIGAIRLFLENGKKAEAVENLQQLEDASRRLVNDVREAIIGLRMSRKITAGLIPAVEAFTQFCGLPVVFHSEVTVEEFHLDPEIQVHILRIIQESLSNIRKHANATHAYVNLRFEDGVVHVVVRDDGQGFDPLDGQRNGSSHFGLQTMRERTQAVGGTFELVTAPRKGTMISVTLKIA